MMSQQDFEKMVSERSHKRQAPYVLDIKRYMKLQAEFGDENAASLVRAILEILEVFSAHKFSPESLIDATSIALSLYNVNGSGLSDLLTPRRK